MNRQQATAIIMYLQRAIGIVPTTGAEWGVIQGALASIEAVANGLATMDAMPVPPPTAEPAKAD